MAGSVVQKEGDPLIYLHLNNQWYYFDTRTQPIGQGAMGVVYLGYNYHSNQRVAVKCVRATYANNPIVRQRAQTEASLTFYHPNIVQMLGICEITPNSGPIFILSNYVQGVTLEEHVRHQLNVLEDKDRIERISKEICSILDALEFLHVRGIVHRDIKPSNLMLEDGKQVKLMDLGIARLNGGNKYSSYGFIGTPQYAAPEQILRDTENAEINATTDIYSLGITYYEFLTGENPMNSPIDSEVLSNQVTKKLPYHKSIPRRLYRVIQKATEKNSSERYQSASEFKRAIEQALQPASPLSLPTWIEANKLTVYIASIALLLIIITLFILI